MTPANNGNYTNDCRQGETGPSGTATPSTVYYGTYGDPNGNQVGDVGDWYKDTADGTLWVKQTGTGNNTGWI